MDTLKIINAIEDMVEDAPKFLGFVRMDEDRFFQMVSKLRASLPEDMRKVSQLADDTDRIRLEAHGAANEHLEAVKVEAERMLAATREEAERLHGAAQLEAAQTLERAKGASQSLIDQSEIARIATAQAREIIAQADAEAAEIRAGADAYAKETLTALEAHIQRAMGQIESHSSALLLTIQRGRQELEKTAPTIPAASTTDAASGRRVVQGEARMVSDRTRERNSPRELVSFGGRR
jgi:hypothetical protein